MRLVFILPAPLVPIRNGQQSTGYNLILELSKIIDLQVVLLYKRGTLTPEIAGPTTEQLTREGIKHSNHEVSAGSMLRLLPIFLPAGFRSWLFARLLGLPPELSSLYRGTGAVCLYFGSSYDLFAHWHVRQPSGAYVFPADSIAYFQNNNRETRIVRRILKPLKRWYAQRIERDLYSGMARNIFYVSEQDQQYLKRQSIDTKGLSRIVRIGVNLPESKKQYSVPPKPIRMAFSGVMAYRPNEEAAFYLTDVLMPKLAGDDVALLLIGKDPSPELLARQNVRISITGEVDDIYQHLLNADVFVSPLFSGAGAKNKVLSALGCGLPVIGTKQSFSGFSSLPPGALVFSTLEELIEQIRTLSKWDIENWRMQSDSANAYIRENFTWAASAKMLLKWISEAYNLQAVQK